MIVRSVRLEHFRNHTSSVLEFGTGVNIILGKNGQGKTNILEAISCSCLTKSFYAANDATLVQLGGQRFDVEGTLLSDSGIEHSIKLGYSKETGEKEFTINGGHVERLSSVIGIFPVVVLSPENGAITFGGPAERRRFIDLVLSQLSRTYFDDLLEYRQVLKQRNRILSESKQRGTLQEEALAPWNYSLAERGSRIVHRRLVFLDGFHRYVERSYKGLVETTEIPSLRYATTLAATPQQSVEALAGNILDELKRRQSEECRRGLSLVGPHRDDIEFELNGINLQKYASQGQHKTFLIALKMAEFLYLKEKREEAPVLLLDDVLSELDSVRSKRLLGHIAELGQAIVTTTDATPFDESTPRAYEQRKFYVEQGTCRPINVGNIQEATLDA